MAVTFKCSKESFLRILLMKTYVSITIAIFDTDYHITNDSHARTISEKLLVCRLCIILLCFYELMVKIYIILTALFQLTDGQLTI